MQVVRIEFAAGGRWVTQGFRLLRRQPFALVGTAALFMLTLALCSQMPLLGPVVLPVLVPVLTVGFVKVAQTVEAGQRPHPLMLFDAFRLRERARLRPLLVLGVVNASLTALAMGMALIADGGALFRSLTGAMDPADPALQDGSITYAMLVFLALSLPTQMLMWYSPLFVAWNGRSAGEALFFSLVSCWRNRKAFIAYIGAWMMVLLAILAGMLLLRALFADQDWVKGLGPGSPFSPLTLVLVAALYASIWPSYRDVVVEDMELTKS